MRVALIVVSMLAAATPSEASRSCMSKTEARQHFASVHIYWHGPDHCWDTAPPRHRQIQTRRKTHIQEVQRRSDQPKWRDSMSAILADDEPVQSLTSSRSSDVEYRETAWADRWVDVEPSQAPIVKGRVHVVRASPAPIVEQKSALMVYAHDLVLLAFFGFIVSLWTVGALYRQEL
jgi:hypothetical protein